VTPRAGDAQGGAVAEGRAVVENFLLWCLFGLIAGAVAQFIMPGRQPGESANPKGFLITIGLGILGAVVGGFLSSQLFNWDVTGFNLPSFAVAVVGALLVLVLYRVVTSSWRTR
jgi:uncharacterized membrane protein YeaQ/YmgE (transglycosylase-associated protein family)